MARPGRQPRRPGARPARRHVRQHARCCAGVDPVSRSPVGLLDRHGARPRCVRSPNCRSGRSSRRLNPAARGVRLLSQVMLSIRRIRLTTPTLSLGDSPSPGDHAAGDRAARPQCRGGSATGGGAWTGSAEYATDLIEVTVAEFACTQLLDGLTADPDAAVGDAGMLDAAASDRVLSVSHGPVLDVPDATTVAAITAGSRRSPMWPEVPRPSGDLRRTRLTHQPACPRTHLVRVAPDRPSESASNAAWR